MEGSDTALTAVDVVCALFSGTAACGGADTTSLDTQCAMLADAPPAIYRLAPEEAAEQAQLKAALAVLERRLFIPIICSLEASVEADGTLTLRIVSAAGDSPIDEALLAPGKLEFYPVDTSLQPGEIAPGFAIFPDRVGDPVTVQFEPLLPPDPIRTAEVIHTDWGAWAVSVDLTHDAGEAFAAATSAHLGEAIAIVVDDVVLMAPRVMEPITGGALMISADFTAEEAIRLAATLNGGSLPDGMRLNLLSVDVDDAQ